MIVLGQWTRALAGKDLRLRFPRPAVLLRPTLSIGQLGFGDKREPPGKAQPEGQVPSRHRGTYVLEGDKRDYRPISIWIEIEPAFGLDGRGVHARSDDRKAKGSFRSVYMLVQEEKSMDVGSTAKQNAKDAQELFNKAVGPFQTFWRSAFFEIPMTVTSELMRFTAHRLEAQADYLKTFNRCASVPEIIDAQSHFVQKAADDYGVEMSRLMEDVRQTTLNKAA